MECPRCGSALERYSLGDREATACPDCGYVGVPVEHRGEIRTAESWAAAVERYAEVPPVESVTVEREERALEVLFSGGEDESDPEPTVVRIERPDPALADALEAAEAADERFVCEVCGAEFDTQQGLYGHLAVHSEGGE